MGSISLIADSQSFVIYSEQFPIFDQADKVGRQIKIVGEVAEISVRDYMNYKVTYFK